MGIIAKIADEKDCIFQHWINFASYANRKNNNEMIHDAIRHYLFLEYGATLNSLAMEVNFPTTEKYTEFMLRWM